MGAFFIIFGNGIDGYGRTWIEGTVFYSERDYLFLIPAKGNLKVTRFNINIFRVYQSQGYQLFFPLRPFLPEMRDLLNSCLRIVFYKHSEIFCLVIF